MANRILEIFDDRLLVKKIQHRLPYLFNLAEKESSRAGKVGMEVGSVREKIIVALLIYKFGEVNVETEIPITEPEVDVKVYGNPLSIKTITGNNLNGIKLIWTVDAQKAKEFSNSFQPSCDMLLIQINWGKEGGFYYIPVSAQQRIFHKLGHEKYIKLPKQGTNPRGIEITKEALLLVVNDYETRSITINWQRLDTKYNPYKRWIDLWGEEEWQ